MDFDDIFLQDENDTCELPKMTHEQFVLETRKMLTKIEAIYSKSWYNSTLPDCSDRQYDKCNGECTRKIKGREVNCQRNSEDGYCYERKFNNEDFSEEMESIMFGDEFSFYELLGCELVNGCDKLAANGESYTSVAEPKQCRVHEVRHGNCG